MENRRNDFILSTSSITGSTVRTLGDEKIGTIKDIMLDTEAGEVVYAVLSVDTGFLNLDSKYFAIPWQAFSFNENYEDVFVLDIDKHRLENSPGFDKDNWPSGPQTEFIDEMNTYYGVESSKGSSTGSDFGSGNRSKQDSGFGADSTSGMRSGTRDSDLGSRDSLNRDSGLGSRDSTFDTRNSSNQSKRESGLGTSDSRIDSGDSSLESRSKPDARDKDSLL